MLLLILALLDSQRPTVPSPGPTYFAGLTLAQAEAEGHRPQDYLIRLDSAASPVGNFMGYDCVGFDTLHRTVLLRALPVNEGRPLVVRGTVRVIRHPARVIEGQHFEGFVELRLTAN